MKKQTLRDTVQRIDARLERVEQILPSLATEAQLQEATDQTTRAIKATGEETRRHMDVVSESTRYEVQLLADGYKAVAQGQRALGKRLDRSIEAIKGVLVNHEDRLSRLERERQG